jgi:catechol 2,3-dioxygenase-like lactoylglutathione lyase family enzyme
MRALKKIEIVTLCIPELDACVPLYEQLLGYKRVDAGKLPEELATTWATPAMTGLRYVLLQTASAAGVYLRFIETGNPGGYWPPVTQGWIATEILTTDPDAVLERLGGSAFTHIGGPAALYDSPNSARALQMAGPAGELMYFTRLLPNGSRFGLHGAKCFVDRPFIMVVGGTSLPDINAFYRDKLGLRVIDQPPFKIRQMSRVLKVSEETAYPISLARLPGRSFLLELEELPAGIERRTVPEGQLPEGLAMVSFSSAPLSELNLAYRSAPQCIDLPPYSGRQVAVAEGAAGEWLELIH